MNIGIRGLIRYVYRFNPRAEGRASGVGEFQIRHAQRLLFLQEMRRETRRGDASRDFVFDVVQEVHVQLNVLLALFENFGLPGGEYGGDVFERGIPLCRVFSWDATQTGLASVTLQLTVWV